MADRRERLRRIYNVTDLMWRCHIRNLADLDARLLDIDKAEGNNLHYFKPDIPYELILSRIQMLHSQRLSIIERKKSEISRANLTGLRLKRIGRLLVKSDKLS